MNVIDLSERVDAAQSRYIERDSRETRRASAEGGRRCLIADAVRTLMLLVRTTKRHGAHCFGNVPGFE
jgi:hypothetical protein